MQQELEQLVISIGAITATIPIGLSFAALFSAVDSYVDAKRYYSLTDATCQQRIGRPKFLEFLKQDLRNIPTLLGVGEFDSSYDQRYFSAYLKSTREQENNKYIGYRKIKENI